MYDTAKSKATEQWDLLQKKTTALSSAAKAPYELQKIIAEANKAQTENAQAAVQANYDYITSQLTGDPTKDQQVIENAASQLGVSSGLLYSTIASTTVSRQKENLLNASNLANIFKDTQKGGTVSIPGVGNVTIAGTDITGKPSILEGNNTAYQYIDGKWVDLKINPNSITPDKLVTILGDFAKMTDDQKESFVNALSGSGITGIPNLGGTTGTVNVGNQVGNIMGLPAYDTRTANPGVNRPNRNNNPGNIKISDLTKNYAGVIGVESSPAEDGGNFAIFDTPANGVAAIGQLFKDVKYYKGVTAERAIKIYNNNGSYGAKDVGLDPNKDFQSQIQDPNKLQQVASTLAQKEGFTAATKSKFDKFTDESTALNVIPIQLRNSQAELERYTQGIQKGLKEGKTPYEIADILMGYNVNPDKKGTFADNIRLMMSQVDGLSKSTPADYARLINSGKKGQVIQKIEQGITKDTDAQKRESTARYTYTMAPSIVQQINALSSKFGLVAGNWNKLKKKVSATPEFQRISTDLTALVQEWRRQMSGTATTPTELKMIDELLPAVTDNPINAAVKVRAFAEMQLNQLNSERGSVNLPELDYATLMDWNKRADLYDAPVKVKNAQGQVGYVPKYMVDNKNYIKIQ